MAPGDIVPSICACHVDRKERKPEGGVVGGLKGSARLEDDCTDRTQFCKIYETLGNETCHHRERRADSESAGPNSNSLQTDGNLSC